MPNFRRNFIPGATCFLTVVTCDRKPFLCTDLARAILREKFRKCQTRWPFQMPAIVLLPDHFHALWSLSTGDSQYPSRIGWIKKEFTRDWLARGGIERKVTNAQATQHRRGVWQPRYWEHTIKDEEDFERHCDYLHYNPVKHGLVTRVRDWPHSSFHRFVKEGIYPVNWGEGSMSFDELGLTAVE